MSKVLVLCEIDTARYKDWQPKETLSDRLHKLRTDHGYSLRDLEELTGVSASTLGRMEGGYDFKFSMLVAVAAAYKLELSDLFANIRTNHLSDVMA